MVCDLTSFVEVAGTVPKNVGGPLVLKQVKYLAKDVSVRPERLRGTAQCCETGGDILPSMASGDKPLLCNGKSMVLAIRQLGDQNLRPIML